jgi:cyclic pyranopterin phosphate synthase
MTQLTHLDADGRARMVDVGGKPETDREAVARGRFLTTPEVVRLVAADDLPKADVLATARIAGIGGAKRTSELIPLCHPLPLSHIDVTIEAGEDAVEITSVVETTAQTGVEMEALTAVTVAALTIYDMCKAIDKAITIGEVRLVEKMKEPV